MSYQDPTAQEVNAPLLAYPESFKWTSATVSITFAQDLSEMRSANNNPVTTPGNSPFKKIEAGDSLRAAVFEVSKIWSDYINLTFVEGTDHSPNIDGIHVAGYIQPAIYAGYSNPPPLGNLFMSSANSDYRVGGVSHWIALHEFGHVLGLRHGGYYNDGDPQIEPSSYQDSLVYSVMSYFGPNRPAPQNGTSVQTAVWTDGTDIFRPQTAMMNDIRALQERYGGANMSTRNEGVNGGTRYGFNTDASLDADEKKIYDFSVNKNPVLCIYDAGGDDTLDLSGFTTRSAISLMPGTFSNAAGMTMNISIAHETIIERAVGGIAADIMLGNNENNLLVGNGGNDIIYGGKGSDTLQGGKGNDTLVGFFSGLSPVATTAPSSGGLALMTQEQANLWNAHASPNDTSEVDYADYRDVVANPATPIGIVADMRFGTNQVTDDGYGNTDTLIGIERILGSARNDTVHLFAETTWFSGGAGTDVVHGRAATNFFDGDAGNDTFNFYGGSSVFNGGADSDTLDLSQAAGGFTIDLHEKKVWTGDAGWFSDPAIEFSSVESFVGSGGDDVFVFNNAALTQAAITKFNGGNGSDLLDFSDASQGIQLLYGSGGKLQANGGGMEFLSFEKFQGGTGSDRLTLLDGMVEAHGGNGSGYDILDISRWTGDIIKYLSNNQIVFSGGAVVVDQFEEIVTKPGQIGIVGTDSAEIFNGSTGDDRIWGNGGNDVFNRSGGNDAFSGGVGDDTFYVKKGDYANGGDDYDIAYLRQEGYGYNAQDLARFIYVEEFHFEGASGVGGTFSGSTEKVFLSATASSNIKFADSSKDREVHGGSATDYFEFWGGGSLDGGGGNDQLDLRKMTGLIWDQTAQEFHWGDRVLSYTNIARFAYNPDTVVQNSIPGALAVAENQMEDGSMFATIGISPGSSDYFWA